MLNNKGGQVYYMIFDIYLAIEHKHAGGLNATKINASWTVSSAKYA